MVGVRVERGGEVALKSGVRVALGVGLIVAVCSFARGVGVYCDWVISASIVGVGDRGGKSARVLAGVAVEDGVAVCPAFRVCWTTVGM